MADITLTAAPILGGVHRSYGENQIIEQTDLAIVSIAIPRGGNATLAKALQTAFNLQMPKPTQSSTIGDMRLIQSTADQMLMLFPHPTPDANAMVQGKLAGAGYTTDQTDNLVALQIKGPGVLKALERLCPLDLHLDSFPIGANARTVMEHLGTTVIRLGEDTFLLLSASSSAHSFLHAVEQSFAWTT